MSSDSDRKREGEGGGVKETWNEVNLSSTNPDLAHAEPGRRSPTRKDRSARDGVTTKASSSMES